MFIKIILLVSVLFLYVLEIKGESGWTIKSTMPTPRYGVCSAKLGDDIYIIGGVEYDQNEDKEEISKVVEKYNPLSDSWGKDIDDLNEERYNAAAVAYEGKIYVIGGREEHGLVKEIEIYDPNSNKWSEASYHMIHKREGAAAVVYNEQIFVIGGYDSQGRYLAKVEIFDPQEDKWKEASHVMNFPRALLAAVTVKDSVFALGGFYYGPLGAAEKLVPDGSWQSITSMSTPRGNFAACTIGKTIYVMGGHSQMGIIQSTEAYDPSTDRWLFKESMNYAREAFTAQVVDNKIYVFGGSNSRQQFLSIVEEYTPEPASVDANDVTVPLDFILYQNYPNPFNSQTIIRYELANKSQNSVDYHVNLTIYNIHGQRVVTLMNGTQKPGSYHVYWHGKDAYGIELTSGVYFCILKVGSHIQTIKLLLTK